MGFRLGVIAALGLMLVLPPAWTCAADAPATRSAKAENQSNSPGDETMPELVVRSMSLGDFVTYLAHQWKDVQFIQVNGPWQDLNLPPLRLRNVTRYQVIMMLTTMYPELYVHAIDPNRPLFSADRNQHGENVLIFQQVKGAAIPMRTRVSAFGLTQTVDRLAFHKLAISAALDQEQAAKNDGTGIKVPDKDSEQWAMKDVLSLIQATLDESAEPDVTPTVMLHEATETVLVKGTSEQINAVQQALQALDNSMSEKSLEGKLMQVTNENNRLRYQLTRLRESEAKLKAATKAGSQDKSGSNQ